MMKVLMSFCVVIMCVTGALSQHWFENFEEAKAMAQKEKLAILMVFQGSDWCAPCMKLDHEIWQSDAFKKHASDHYVLLRVDFPKRKKNLLSEEKQAKNNALAEIYNPSGIFPLVVLMDANGNKIGTTGYKNITPEDYVEHLESIGK